MSYLYLFAYSGVQHILWCVFLFCFSSSCVPCVTGFSGLSFLIAPSVFSNVYSNYINSFQNSTLCYRKRNAFFSELTISVLLTHNIKLRFFYIQPWKRIRVTFH